MPQTVKKMCCFICLILCPRLLLQPRHYLRQRICRTMKQSNLCPMVEQNLAKCRLVKAEPLPISKMENDCMNGTARFKVSWIAGITFSKRAVVLKFVKSFILRSKLCEFLKSICSNRYATPPKKNWKMIIEYYIILPWLYCKVKVRNETPWGRGWAGDGN